MVRHAALAFTFIAASSVIAAQSAANIPTPDALITAFKQGAQNNCAATAVIKAALGTFGMENTNGVFKTDVTNDSGSHDIVMRDGSKVSVTAEQIQQAKKLALWASAPNHAIDDPILQRASVLYAAMAKHAVDLNSIDPFTDAKDYARSLQRISDPGRDSDGQVQLLGLACKQIALSDVSHPVYIHSNNWHAAFATLADYDQEGERLPLDPTFQKRHHSWHKNGSKYWENYILVDPGGPLSVNQENPCPAPAP
jgi:hypothetical protein